MAALEWPKDPNNIWERQLYEFLMENTEHYKPSVRIPASSPPNGPVLSRTASYHVLWPYNGGSPSGTWDMVVILPKVVVDGEVISITIPTAYYGGGRTFPIYIHENNSTYTLVTVETLSLARPTIKILKITSPAYATWTVPRWQIIQ